MELNEDNVDAEQQKQPEDPLQPRGLASRRQRRTNQASKSNTTDSGTLESINIPETTASETPTETGQSVQQNPQHQQPITTNLIPECNIDAPPTLEVQGSTNETQIDDDQVVKKEVRVEASKNDDTNNNIRDDEFPRASVPDETERLQGSLESDFSQSVSAVRVLFRDQHPLQRQQVNLNTNNPITGNRVSHSARLSRQLSASSTTAIVDANRRLIERQIEAMQEADSRRWNFDFRNCRPLNQSGHRYMHYNEPALRPLGDQNQSVVARFDTHQQRWHIPTTQSNQSDKKQGDK